MRLTRKQLEQLAYDTMDEYNRKLGTYFSANTVELAFFTPKNGVAVYEEICTRHFKRHLSETYKYPCKSGKKLYIRHFFRYFFQRMLFSFRGILVAIASVSYTKNPPSPEVPFPKQDKEEPASDKRTQTLKKPFGPFHLRLPHKPHPLI